MIDYIQTNYYIYKTNYKYYFYDWIQLIIYSYISQKLFIMNYGLILKIKNHGAFINFRILD